MRTIIHDLNDNEINNINFRDDDIVISSLGCKNSCIGCFSCWIKHPTKCIYKDDYSNMIDHLKQSDEFIIISKNRYGCYSYSIKRVLERCIGYVLPYFTIRDNEMHHISRYDNKLNLSVYFYDNTSEVDKKLTEQLINANKINLNAKKYNIYYINDLKELETCLH